MNIKYPNENKYMKCVLQMNRFSDLCPRVRSILQVWERDIVSVGLNNTCSQHVSDQLLNFFFLHLCLLLWLDIDRSCP